jgi:hypothetical protein
MSLVNKSAYWQLVFVLIMVSGCKPGIRTSHSISSITTTLAPSILNITPPNSTTAGGELITITGQGFVADSTVTIGRVTCNSVVIVSATEIQCHVPSHVAGSLPVIVTAPNQQAASASFLYYLPAQNVSNFTVNLGGGPTVGHAGGLGARAISAAGESVQAIPQAAVGVSAKTGIVNTTTAQ